MDGPLQHVLLRVGSNRRGATEVPEADAGLGLNDKYVVRHLSIQYLSLMVYTETEVLVHN